MTCPPPRSCHTLMRSDASGSSPAACPSPIAPSSLTARRSARRNGLRAARPLLLPFVCLLTAIIASGCASSQFREQDRIGRWMTTLEQHLHAPTPRDAASHLAEGFEAEIHRGGKAKVQPVSSRSSAPHDGTDDGSAVVDRQEMVKLLEGEFALHRTITASDFRFDEATITATCFAENDLSRLVEFPGWETTVTWTFDARGKIARAVVNTPAGAPDFRNWLAPAINWLRTHRAADLDWLAPGGRPPGAGNLSPRTAKRWVEVLTDWRHATDRRPIRLSNPTEAPIDPPR